MEPVFEGPFTIVRRTKGGSYVLKDPTESLLPRNYAIDQLKPLSHAPVPTDQAYEVEAVLNHKTSRGKIFYFIKWKNYDDSHNSWEPEDNFLAQKCIAAYWNRRNGKPSKRQVTASTATLPCDRSTAPVTDATGGYVADRALAATGSLTRTWADATQNRPRTRATARDGTQVGTLAQDGVKQQRVSTANHTLSPESAVLLPLAPRVTRHRSAAPIKGRAPR